MLEIIGLTESRVIYGIAGVDWAFLKKTVRKMLCTGARHRYLKPTIVKPRWQAYHVWHRNHALVLVRKGPLI